MGTDWVGESLWKGKEKETSSDTESSTKAVGFYKWVSFPKTFPHPPGEAPGHGPSLGLFSTAMRNILQYRASEYHH